MLLTDGLASTQHQSALQQTYSVPLDRCVKKALPIRNGKDTAFLGFAGNLNTINKAARLIRSELPKYHWDGKELWHDINALGTTALNEDLLAKVAGEHNDTPNNVISALVTSGWAPNTKKLRDAFWFAYHAEKRAPSDITRVAIIETKYIHDVAPIFETRVSFGNDPEFQVAGTGGMSAVFTIRRAASAYNFGHSWRRASSDIYLRIGLEALLSSHVEPSVGGAPQAVVSSSNGFYEVPSGSVKLCMLLAQAALEKRLPEEACWRACEDLFFLRRPYTAVLRDFEAGASVPRAFYVALLGLAEQPRELNPESIS